MPITDSYPYVSELIRSLAIVPELTRGVPNWSFVAAGGAVGNVTIDTIAGGGDHDLNLAVYTANDLQGCQVYWRAGSANAGLFSTIASGSIVAGTVTLNFADVLPNAVLAGDAFYISAPIPAENIALSRTVDQLERDVVRKTFAPPKNLKGLVKGQGSFDCELWGLAQAATALLPKDVLSNLLQGFGSRAVTDGMITGIGSTAVNIVATTDPALSVLIGDPVCISDEIRYVTSIDSVANEFGIAPSLSEAPAAGVAIRVPERWYAGRHTGIFTAPDLGGETMPPSMTILCVYDRQLLELRGCQPNYKVAADFSQKLKLSVEVSGTISTYSDNTDYDFLLPAMNPILMISGQSVFGATPVFTNSWEGDLGLERPETMDTGGGLAYFVRNRASRLKMVLRNVGITPIMTWDAGQTEGLAAAFAGTGHLNAFGFALGNASLAETPTSASVQNTKYWDCSFRETNEYTSAGAKRPMIFRF